MCARQWPVWDGWGPRGAIPTPRGTRAVPGWPWPHGTSPALAGGFWLLPVPPGFPLGPCPESSGGVAIRRLPSQQLGGCRCSRAAADLHVCLRRATFVLLRFPPWGHQCAAISCQLLPTAWRAIPGTCVTPLLPRHPKLVGPSRRGGSAAHGGLETYGCLAAFCLSWSWHVGVGSTAS